MFSGGFFEIGGLLFVAYLLFGPKKLPEIARTLGKGMAELKRASNELKRSLEEEISNLEHIPESRKEIATESVPTYGDHHSEPAHTESEPRS